MTNNKVVVEIGATVYHSTLPPFN